MIHLPSIGFDAPDAPARRPRQSRKTPYLPVHLRPLSASVFSAGQMNGPAGGEGSRRRPVASIKLEGCSARLPATSAAEARPPKADNRLGTNREGMQE